MWARIHTSPMTPWHPKCCDWAESDAFSKNQNHSWTKRSTQITSKQVNTVDGLLSKYTRSVCEDQWRRIRVWVKHQYTIISNIWILSELHGNDFLLIWIFEQLGTKKLIENSDCFRRTTPKIEMEIWTSFSILSKTTWQRVGDYLKQFEFVYECTQAFW